MSSGNPVVSLAEGIGDDSKIDNTNCDSDGNGLDEAEKDGDEWFVPQNPVQENIQTALQPPTYGFGSKVSGALASFEVCATLPTLNQSKNSNYICRVLLHIRQDGRVK